MSPQSNAARCSIPGDPVEHLMGTVSATRLNTWHCCRLKYRFRYVDRIEKPRTPSLQVGMVVHGVLQGWNMGRWKKAPLGPPECHALFNHLWAAETARVDWEGDEEVQKATARDLIDTFLRETPIETGEAPEGVEVAVEADLARHGLPVLIGVLDLVQGGRIIDFKTAARSPGGEVLHQHEVQLSCYSILYREATGRREQGRELHHLVKTKVPKLVVTSFEPMSPKQEERLCRLIESHMNGLARRDFVPSVGMQCGACEYAGECRDW